MTADLERANAPESVGAGPGPASTGPTLAAGVAIAGRYTIDVYERRSPYAEIYRATDSRSGHPVSLHLIAAPWTSRAALVDTMLAGAQAATGIEHKNVARTLEVGREGAHAFVVTEYLEGNPLRELLARKQQTGAGGFGARAANNILGGVCHALSAAHLDVAHGALGPDSVYVNKAGRVKVADFGLGAAVPASAAAGAQPPPSLAPEDARSGAPSRGGDLFAAGVLLYELLVGRPLQRGGKRPSEVADVGPSVDELIARCCAPAPEGRPADPAAFKAALSEALRTPSAQQAAAQPTAAASGPLGAAASGPMPAASASLPASVSTPLSGSGASNPAAGLPSALIDDDHERWLISRNRLDYGPFTFSDVVEQIRTDEIQPGNVIIDNDTGERCAVEDHPALAHLVDQAQQARDDRRRAQAEVSHAKQETRRGFALYGFVGAGVLALGLAAFFIVKGTKEASKDTERGGIASIEEGKLQPKFSFPEPKKKVRRKSSSGRRSAGGSSGGDEAEVMDFDDDVGSERLGASDVNPVLQSHGGRLGGCIQKAGGGYVHIWFAVKGKTGKVYTVKVNGETSGSLYSCINRAMRSMSFPTFDGIRSGHEFEISL